MSGLTPSDGGPPAQRYSDDLVRSTVAIVVLLPLWTFGALFAAKAVWRAVVGIPWGPSDLMYVLPAMYVAVALLGAALFLVIRWVSHARMSTRASVALAGAGATGVPLAMFAPILSVSDPAFALGPVIVAATGFGLVLVVDRVVRSRQQ